MTIKLRWLLEAAGAGLLVSLPYYVQLLYPNRIALFHHNLHQANLIFGVLLALLAVILIGFAFIVYVENRFAPKARAILGAAISGVVFLRSFDLFLFLLVEWRTTLYAEASVSAHGVPVFAGLRHVTVNPLFRIGVLVVFGLLALGRPQAARPVVKTARLLAGALGLCAVWIIPKLSVLGLAPERATVAPQSVAQGRTGVQERIVWILFDELSYNLVFDHPPQGMTFPNFWILRSTSATFSEISPIGFSTDRIIPSLLAGKEIHEIASDPQGRLFYSGSRGQVPQVLDPSQTLFGFAHANGWNPGIVGWYNPYCRIFVSELSACWWGPGVQARIPGEVIGASEEHSILYNAALLIPAFLFNPGVDKSEIIGPRRANFLESIARAHHLIQDQNIHFVFLHISVPHPPGFYDRRTHKLCECGNYLDNLVLADDTLATLLREIKQTPEKDQTTLIVSSDHSWRVPLWKGADDWTAEEESVSKGQFDDRPVFLVHFPGQTGASNISAPMSELREHDIVAAMLQDKLDTPQELLGFVQAGTNANNGRISSAADSNIPGLRDASPTVSLPH
jgi:hypothetical protein